MRFIKTVTVTTDQEISFIEARELLKWTTATRAELALPNMTDTHIGNVISILSGYKLSDSNISMNRLYTNREWIKIFQKELMFRAATRKLLSLSSITNKF
jgi:hypothetical protein